MTRLHRLLAVLIGWGAMGSGCSATGGTGPLLVDHDVQGSWYRTPFAPGSAFLVALTESAGVVTGTGTFAREAGAGGALTISGSVREDSVHLQVVFVFDPPVPGGQPDTTSFVGVLSATDTIVGTLTGDGVAQSIRLVRLKLLALASMNGWNVGQRLQAPSRASSGSALRRSESLMSTA